jgi:cephalosporin hydroxylase
MRLSIDTEAATLQVDDGGGRRSLPLYSAEAFALLSGLWVKLGWSLKYSYGFTWFGRPIIQLPEDMVRVQELLYRLQPDVLVETGVAHGGSLVFYASLFKALGRGRVIGVDVEIRPHNRAALEAHVLKPLLTLIEGDSSAPEVVARVRGAIAPGETVLVMLDSNHSRAHVAAELEAYAPLVGSGSYLIVADGIMRELADVPRGNPDWVRDNPLAAVADFLAAHPEFRAEPPQAPFDERLTSAEISYWSGGWLRRR